MQNIKYIQYINMTQYDNIVVTPVYGPLSTNQYPGSMRPHNLGALPGRHPNPPQYYPSNNSSEFANARHEYARVAVATTARNRLAQSTKYIAPSSSSMLTSVRKRTAVGKSSYKQGMPDAALLSYKNYNKNDVKTAIQRARSRGYVAPKKIGAIQNNSLRNGQICAWGSLYREPKKIHCCSKKIDTIQNNSCAWKYLPQENTPL